MCLVNEVTISVAECVSLFFCDRFSALCSVQNWVFPFLRFRKQELLITTISKSRLYLMFCYDFKWTSFYQLKLTFRVRRCIDLYLNSLIDETCCSMSGWLWILSSPSIFPFSNRWLGDSYNLIAAFESTTTIMRMEMINDIESNYGNERVANRSIDLYRKSQLYLCNLIRYILIPGILIDLVCFDLDRLLVTHCDRSYF